MARKTATQIVLSEKQEQILKEKAFGTHTPLHYKTRAQIILYASKGMTNNEIERRMDLDPHTIKIWRDRYGAKYDELQKTELERPHKMRSLIEKILSDERRPGGPSKFKDEQVAAIIALACEEPSKFDLPFSHWTPRLLQIEAVKLGIVDSISVRQVGRFLKGAGLTTAPKQMLVKS